MKLIEEIYKLAGCPLISGLLTTQDWQKLPASKRPSLPPNGQECYLTGLQLDNAGVPTAFGIKPTFTDSAFAASPYSEWLHPATAYSLSDSATVPNFSSPVKMRCQTHILTGGNWFCIGMSEKDKMRDVLLNPPSQTWGMAMTDSPLSAGHQLYRTPMNNPANTTWRVMFSGEMITSNTEEYRELQGDIDALYQAGHNKSAIESGNYNPATINKHGLSAWSSLESKIQRFRYGTVFSLCIFLSQKTDEKP